MAACSGTKRARTPALEATVATLSIPGLGKKAEGPYEPAGSRDENKTAANGIFVLANGTRLFSASRPGKIKMQAERSGWLAVIAGNDCEYFRDWGGEELADGEDIAARFNLPRGLTMDRAGNMVVVDSLNNAIRKVNKEGTVISTLAGGNWYDSEDEEIDGNRFADGQGENAHFSKPWSVVVAANDELIVSDTGNHSIRVLTPQGAVRTLCDNGKTGFADGTGADARFNEPRGLALDPEGNLLVADFGNDAIRLVTMAGAVSTVAGNGVKGFADGVGAAARFNGPNEIVVDGKGTIVVADKENHRLRKIVGRLVTTLAGSSEAGTADGAGAGARFNKPCTLALDQRGRLLVAEFGRSNTLRVVEASLAPPLWMSPVEKNSEEAPMPAKAQAALAALQDYSKMVEDPELADVVLVVEGERFPAHRGVLAASYLYTNELPESGEGGAGGEGDKVHKDGSGSESGKGKGKESKGEVNKGGKSMGQKSMWDGEHETHRQVFGRAMLKAADLFRLEALLQHCVESFQRGLTVHTAIEQLVWAHNNGPEEARTVATEYFVDNCRRIRSEARDTIQLLKWLPPDVSVELIEALCD